MDDRVRKLGTKKKFDYFFYDGPVPELISEYETMFALHKLTGKTMRGTSAPTDVNAGFLVKYNGEVICGYYINLVEGKEEIQIVLAYTLEEFRGRGIWKTLLKYIDKIAIEKNKLNIFAYIKTNNQEMINTTLANGYSMIAAVVHRKVKT